MEVQTPGYVQFKTSLAMQLSNFISNIVIVEIKLFKFWKMIFQHRLMVHLHVRVAIVQNNSYPTIFSSNHFGQETRTFQLTTVEGQVLDIGTLASSDVHSTFFCDTSDLEIKVLQILQFTFVRVNGSNSFARHKTNNCGFGVFFRR